MTTIVTRAGKGSALTFTEGDANFTNLNNDKLENITGESIGDLSDVDLTGNADNYILVWDSATSSFKAEAQSAGASNLDALADVILTTPANNEVLKYNGTDWVNGTASIGSINDIDDTSITTPSNGQALVYNNGNWENQAVSISQLSGTLDCQDNLVQSPQLKDYAETVYSIGSNDSPTITISNGNVQSVTISSGLSLSAFSDAATGQSVTLLVSGSGSATGTANHKFAGGNKTLTNDSVVSIFYDGTTYWTSIATDFQV